MPSEAARYLPNDPDSALRWLSVGLDLVRTQRPNQEPDSLGVIWALLEEAVEVMDRLPDPEKSCLSIGDHAAGFDSNGLTRRELLALEQLRYLAAMMPHDGPTARVIDRSQATRAFDVMLWFRWVGVHVACKDVNRMVKAAVALARGGDCEIFHRIWRPGSKPHRQAVKNFRVQFCGHILEGLSRDLGIVPIPGGAFVRRSHNRPPALEAAFAVA